MEKKSYVEPKTTVIPIVTSCILAASPGSGGSEGVGGGYYD